MILLSYTIPSTLGLVIYCKERLTESLAADLGESTRNGARPTSGRAPLVVVIPAKISNEIETLPETVRQFAPIEHGGRGVELPPNALILLAYNSDPTRACQDLLNDEERKCLKKVVKIAAKIPNARFEAIFCPVSKTKSENVNAQKCDRRGERRLLTADEDTAHRSQRYVCFS